MKIIVKKQVVLKSLLIVTLLAMAFSHTLENFFLEYQEGSMKGALALYATTRALNAGISVLQGMDLNAVVVSVSIGEVLDPLNDLIERFSWIVMMAIASLGIQKVMLGIVASKAINILLAVIASLYLITVWVKPLKPYQRHSYKAVCILLFVRFSLSMVFVSNYALDNFFFAEDKLAAEAVVTETKDAVESTSSFSVAEQESAEDESIFDKVKNTYSETKKGFLSAGSKVFDVTNSIEKAISSLLDLMVYFILQTVLLPIAFLLFFWKGLKSLLNSKELPNENTKVHNDVKA